MWNYNFPINQKICTLFILIEPYSININQCSLELISNVYTHISKDKIFMEYSKHVNSWKSLSLRWQNIFSNTWSAFMVKAQCHNIGVHIQKLLPFVSSNEAPNINIIHKNVFFGYHSLEIIFIRHTNFLLTY